MGLTEDCDPGPWALVRSPPRLSFPGNLTMNPREGHKASIRAMFNHMPAERQIRSESAVPAYSSVCRAGLQRAEHPQCPPTAERHPWASWQPQCTLVPAALEQLSLGCWNQSGCVSLSQWPCVTESHPNTPSAPLGHSLAVSKWGQNSGHFVECSEYSVG